jgi:hypothetical protein
MLLAESSFFSFIVTQGNIFSLLEKPFNHRIRKRQSSVKVQMTLPTFAGGFTDKFVEDLVGIALASMALLTILFVFLLKT